MEESNERLPYKGKVSRAAILAMALSGMMTVEAANLMLSRTNPGEAPFTREEFQDAQRGAASQGDSSADSASLLASFNSKSKTASKSKSEQKDKSKTKSKQKSYTIISVDNNDDGSIVAVLKQEKGRKKIKMIDDDGDRVFDRLTTMKGKPLSITPDDINITNLADVLKDLRDEPPMVIYGGPVIDFPPIPIEPDESDINIGD